MSTAENRTPEECYDEFWNLTGRHSAEVFILCAMVPTEESFRAMLRSAYLMGWAERDRLRDLGSSR